MSGRKAESEIGPERRSLYFAYGSNLDLAQMRHRCPRARLLGAAVLTGYRLGFAGQSAAWGGAVATVWRDGMSQVPGLLWGLSAEDMAALDRYEGHPVAYQRRRLLVWSAEGRRRHAFVYVKEDGEAASPSEVYFGVIWRAYRQCGFDVGALALAAGGE